MARPQAQTMHVPAGLPIDQATRPELLDVGQANVLNSNVRQDERGSLGKRLGFEDLGLARFDATSRSAGARLLTHGDLTGVIDGTQLDIYDEDKALWQNAGRVPSVSVSAKTTQAIAGNLLDLVHCNGYVVTLTWVDTAIGSNDFVYVHVETVDGVVVRKQESIGPGMPNPPAVNGGLVTYGNIVIALSCAATTNFIAGSYLDCTSAATIATGWVSLGSLITNKTNAGTGGYLFATQSLSAAGAVAYVNNSGGASQVSVFLVTSAGIGTTTTVNTSSVKPDSVGLGGSTADRLYVAWNETTSIKMIGLNPTTLAISSTTATIITAATAPNVSCPYILHTGTGAGHLIVRQDLRTTFRAWTAAAAMATSGAQVEARVFPVARPFVRSGRLYQPFRSDPSGSTGTSNAQAILCDFTDIYTNPWVRPIAQAYPGQVVNTLGQAYANPWIVDANTVVYAYAIQRSLIASAVVSLVRHNFADTARWDHDEVNDTTYLSGGILSVFDGAMVTEAGFLHAPSQPTLALTGTGITGTNFRYVAVFETIDAAGNAVSSAVSQVSSPISPANQQVNATVGTLAITSRLTMGIDRRVIVSLFRTTTGGAPPYYLVRSAEMNTSGISLIISDVTSDATLTTHRLLYGTGNLPGTNGSGQDRWAFPYANDVVSFNGMVVVLSGSDLWWSGQIIDGEAVWTNPLFQTPVPGRGDGVALAVQDGTLYAFKSDQIYAFAGEPPSDNGSAGGLGSARRLSSDVGCVNKRSVVVCGLGVFFESERGFELLDRSGAVTWVGEQVQETLASFPVITSAVLDERNSLVRFSLNASFGSSGRDLIYDLTLRTWVSVDDKSGTVGSEGSADACVISLAGVRRYAWLGTDGIVWYEQLASAGTAYLDNGFFVPSSYTLPPWKFGLAQELRSFEFMLTVERHSAAGLTVEVARDFGAFVPAETKTWLEAATASQIRLPFRPKALTSAIQFRITDTDPSVLGTGRGFTFIGLSADIAPKQGTTRGTPRIDTSLRR